MSNQFLMGVLALPVLAVIIAAAVAAVFGAWVVLEKWRSGRYGKLARPAEWPTKSRHNEPGQRPVMFLGRPAHLGDRGKAGASILTWPHLVFFQILPGAALMFVWGGLKTDPKLRGNMERALRKAMEDINDEEEIEAA